MLYRRLFHAQTKNGPNGPNSATSSNAYKFGKAIEQEISVEIDGMITSKGVMTPELCAFWKGRPDCGTGKLIAGEVRAKGFKITHTVLPDESEAHALIEAITGEITPTMVADLASITEVILKPDKDRKEIPS